MDFVTLIIIVAVVAVAIKILFWVFVYKAVNSAIENNLSDSPYTFGHFESDYNHLLQLFEEANRMQQEQGFQASSGQASLPQQAEIQQKLFKMNQQMRHLDDLSRQRADLMKGDLMGMASSYGFDASFLS